MENALEVRGLTKHYRGFTLDGVSFSLPTGCIMGFIGENGAGKSTTIRLMLGLARAEAGSVRLLGEDPAAGGAALREKLGVVMDDCGIPETLSLRDMRRILSAGYRTFDAGRFDALAARFELPERKLVKDYSRGMRMKLSLAAALAHRPRLLVLDEPTGGLDPVARDGILDILNDFTRDETHAVLLSSHILSDLEKICDYVALLRRGKLLFCEEKDRLTESCAVVRLPERELDILPEHAVLGLRRNGYAAEALVRRDALPPSVTAERTTLEEIVLLLSKHETERE